MAMSDPCNRMKLFVLALAVAGGLLAEMPAHGDIIYVDSSVTESGDGTKWSEAFKTLQEALDETVQFDDIWVAVGDGPYLPTEEEDIGGEPLEIRTRTFTLQSDVGI